MYVASKRFHSKTTFRFRSNKNSFERKVVKEDSYFRTKKRSLISLQMCCTSWMIELIVIVSAIITPPLRKLGITNLHYIDALVMFVVIPFVHLMNDEDTKIIIMEKNWYQGIRHMLGVYTSPELRRENQGIELDRIRRVQP